MKFFIFSILYSTFSKGQVSSNMNLLGQEMFQQTKQNQAIVNLITGFYVTDGRGLQFAKLDFPPRRRKIKLTLNLLGFRAFSQLSYCKNKRHQRLLIRQLQRNEPKSNSNFSMNCLKPK